MINRRDFARRSAAALATALRLPHAAAATSPVPYGVQLYSVRQLIANSLPAVLQGIRRIGYTQVELHLSNNLHINFGNYPFQSTK